MRLLRRRAATTELDEAAAYARCHETPGRDVRIVKLPPRRERYDVLAAGERLRRSFEDRLDARALEEIGPLDDPFTPPDDPSLPLPGASLAVRRPEEQYENTGLRESATSEARPSARLRRDAAPEAGSAGREAKPARDA